MIVLKLGGSLLSQAVLQQWLLLASRKGKGQLVIVPGGGVFAEQIRLTQEQWQYSDRTAHQMAILAMQQVALLFQGLCADLVLVNKIGLIPENLQQNKVVVWLPEVAELDALEVPATWDITSDTLAVFLAKQLQAENTFLIKSAKIPAATNLQQLSGLGIVDKACATTAKKLAVNVQCLQSNQFAFFASFLTGNA